MNGRGTGIVALRNGYIRTVEIVATSTCFDCELLCLDIIADKTFPLISVYRRSITCRSNSEQFLHSTTDLCMVDHIIGANR